MPNSELEKRSRREYAQRDPLSFNEDESDALDKLYERRDGAIAFQASEKDAVMDLARCLIDS